MKTNNEVKLFLNWAAPVALFGAPLTLGILGYATWRDSNSGLKVDLADPKFMFAIAMCIVGFLVALHYCRNELGWFKRKKCD